MNYAKKLTEVISETEQGVYNYCENGNCIGCGRCCSALLPISNKEIKDIKRYVKKKHIKLAVHCAPAVNVVDMTCPFLDESKRCGKCLVYPVRPKICRTFQCNQPPSQIKENKDQFWKDRQGVYMWDVNWYE